MADNDNALSILWKDTSSETHPMRPLSIDGQLVIFRHTPRDLALARSLRDLLDTFEPVRFLRLPKIAKRFGLESHHYIEASSLELADNGQLVRNGQ